MEVRATLRNTRSGPRKLRKVLALVKGKTVGESLPVLKYHATRGAAILYKLVHAAAANAAVLDKKVVSDELVICGAWVNQGPVLKRYRPMSMGRAGRIRRRTSTVTVVVSDAKARAKRARAAKTAAAKTAGGKE